jgi:hypothetical protein
MARPLILVSNDDGITSRGILNLVNVMKELGEVIVVAPDGPQSGMGHAITVGDTLRLNESFIFEGVRAFECSGTPADCIKMARHFVLKDERQPDVVVIQASVSCTREQCLQRLKVPLKECQPSVFHCATTATKPIFHTQLHL